MLTSEEARQFERAERFLSTVRCHIHYLTGRADDRLSFDLQREIAERLGYQDRPGSRGVERFMKHYYLHAKTVGDLTRIFVAALEDSRRRKPKLAALWQTLRPRELDGFKLDGERLARRQRRRLRARSGGDPAPLPCGAGERPRHPSRDACG